MTLPGSPAVGTYIQITDAGSWKVNPITIARNGSTIEGVSDDIVLDLTGVTVEFFYAGTTWQVTATTGVQGAQGTQGAQGIQGIQGTQGRQGIQGLDGAFAAQGIQGSTGDQGLQGEQGIQGIPGEFAAQGIQGSQGTQGIQGRQGIQGNQGVQGRQGIQGGQGENGNQGIQGIQGIQGRQGIQGLDGAFAGQGIQGSQGTQGIQGPFGPQGIQGTQGTQGVIGSMPQPRVSTSASFASPLIWNSDNFDLYAATAQSVSLTINADAGTPFNGQKMIFRIKDNGTARALTFTTGVSKGFRAIGVALPTTTVVNKVIYVGCIYNAAEERWDAVAVAQEG
jgi:hypothetical protein